MTLGSGFKVVAMLASVSVLAACGGGGSSSGGGVNAGGEAPVLFALANETELSTKQVGSRYRQVDGTNTSEGGARLTPNTLATFTRKAVPTDRISVRYQSPDATAGTDTLVIFDVTETTQDGVTFFSGTAVKNSNNAGRVDTRTITAREARQNSSIYGLLDVLEEKPGFGTYQNFTAYSAGDAAVDPATIVSTAATYSGDFLGVIVLGESAGGAAGTNLLLFGELDMTTNFTTGDVTGGIDLTGNSTNDIAFQNGTTSASGFSGDAVATGTVGTGGFALTNNAAGDFEGEFFAGGDEAAGVLQIIDGDKILSGAYGGTADP